MFKRGIVVNDKGDDLENFKIVFEVLTKAKDMQSAVDKARNNVWNCTETEIHGEWL